MDVSFIIAAARFDDRLAQTIKSLKSQNTDATYEIIVAVAEPEAALDRLSQCTPGICIIPNPKGSAAAGLNVALSAAGGELVARIDARCFVPSDYCARLIEQWRDASSRRPIGAIGGPAVVMDESCFGAAYARAFNGGLLGPSRYRVSTRPGAVDTVYLGAWSRELVSGLGGFDESLLRNQDNDLAARIRQAGLDVFYSPTLAVGYYSDRGIIASMRHHFEFGKWRVLQGRQTNVTGLERKHWSALGALVGAGFAAPVIAKRVTSARAMVRAVMVLYLLIAGLAGLNTGRMRRLVPFRGSPVRAVAGALLSPAAAVAIDLAWLAGVLTSALGLRSRRR